MEENYPKNPPDRSQDQERAWAPQLSENNLQQEDFIGTYRHHHALAQHPQYHQPIYESPEEEFDLDYGFPQGYYATHEQHAYHHHPVQSNYRVRKESQRLRRLPSHGQLVPQPRYLSQVSTPPGSAGIPGPSSIPPFHPQWDEKHKLEQVNGSVPPARHSNGGSGPANSAPLNSGPISRPSSVAGPSSIGGGSTVGPISTNRKKPKKEKDSSAGPVPRNKFTLEEDAKILHLRFDHELSWSLIADNYLPARSEKSLQVHFSVSLRDQVPAWARHWTPKEDEELMELVSEHQRAMWTVISKRLGDGEISPTACFARSNYLSQRRDNELEESVNRLKEELRN